MQGDGRGVSRGLEAMRSRYRCGLLWLFVSAWGCGGPMIYPRSAEIADGWHAAGHMNLALGSAEVAFGDAAQDVAGADGDQVEPSGAAENVPIRRGFAGWPKRSVDSAVSRLLLVPLTMQAQLSYAPHYGFSLGGWFGPGSAGLEARAQLVSQYHGGPFAAALSVGALAPSLFGGGGLGTRFGADLGRAFGEAEITLGVYGSWEPRQRHVAVLPAGVQGEVSFGSTDGVTVQRHEWKLSLPLGLSLGQQSDPRLVFGVVPEWTLDAGLTRSECEGCSDALVLDFEQVFALFFTLGAEL